MYTRLESITGEMGWSSFEEKEAKSKIMNPACVN